MNGGMMALAPALILAGGALLTLVLIAVWRSHTATAAASGAILACALASVPLAYEAAPATAGPLFLLDEHTLWYTVVILAAALGVTLLAHGYLSRQEEPPEELYPLLLISTLGAVLLAASAHIASLFLALETLTVPLYAMIGYLRAGVRSVEAAIKYLILASTASAVLLFGAALLYAETGAMTLHGLAAAAGEGIGPAGAAGAVLVFAGLAFKLALVPFHMWTPDVYQGAPVPVTAFVATVSKGAVVAVALRLYAELAPTATGITIFQVLLLISAASMIAGNVLALLQRSVKRLLAYSSIAHFGYLLVPLMVVGRDAAVAVGYYLAAYVAMKLLAFSVVTIVSARPSGMPGSEADADDLEAFRGLMWQRPLLSFALALSLLSLAGIPLTAGFLAKVYVLATGASAALWGLLILVALTSAVGLFYYLRLLVVTFLPEENGAGLRAIRVPWPAALVTAVFALLVVGLGVYPESVRPLLEAAATAVVPP